MPARLPPPAATSGGGGSRRSGNKDDRTLDGLAANASDQRDARQSGGTRTQQLGTASSGGGGSGTGVLLWIALGFIVLWAAVMGFRNFRNRDGVGQAEGETAS